MKRVLVFALFVPMTLITVARSQTAGAIHYAGSANGEPASLLAPLRSDESPVAPVLKSEVARLANQVLREKEASASGNSATRGGLWLSGDMNDALARLCWIVGPENIHLLNLESDNRITLNADGLAMAAKADEAFPEEACLLLATYISANEGLMLLLQITESEHRYLLHVGSQAPTADGDIVNTSLRNLDNNFDSRINPYRKNGVKLRNERPPADFDSMVAINPAVSWLNLRTKLLVPPGGMTFHELAEAHAKIEFGFDYLKQGSRPGAHEWAIEREEILVGQRPFSDAVATKGLNHILINTPAIEIERNGSSKLEPRR